MIDEDRDQFDAIVEEEIASLPPLAQRWVEQVPIVVLDQPTDQMLEEMGFDRVTWPRHRREICGLHTGISLPDRSIERPEAHATDQIHLFREGITRQASAWDWHDPEAGERLREEIRITLLHELGHHFGLDEDELDRLGYA